MPSITEMMSAIRFALSSICFMATTALPTTSPPWRARLEASPARPLAVEELSALALIEADISSIVAAVSSSAEAWDSPREARSSAPLTIVAAPSPTDAEVSMIWPIRSVSLSMVPLRVRCSAANSPSNAPFIFSVRSPSAIWVNTREVSRTPAFTDSIRRLTPRASLSSSSSSKRFSSRLLKSPATAASTISPKDRPSSSMIPLRRRSASSSASRLSSASRWISRDCWRKCSSARAMAPKSSVASTSATGVSESPFANASMRSLSTRSGGDRLA